jgi:Ca2+-binding EF-hand superfamily protein
MRKLQFVAFVLLGAFILIPFPTRTMGQRPALEKNQHANRFHDALPAWFKALDKDGDGQITLKEWLEGGLDLDEFREYDLNHDGLITPDEVLRYLKKPFELTFENGQVNYDGTIEATGDTYRGKKSFKIFTIKLEQGRTYRINHISKTFQAFLYLEDPDGNLLQQNSSPNVGGNSRIVFRADKTGSYRLIVSSLAGVRTGAFSLTVRSRRVLTKGLPAWFKNLDKDGDGEITLQQWLEGGMERDLFREYDLNDDGVITADEVLRCLKKLVELKLENGQANYDGAIEEAEETYRDKKSWKLFTIKLEQGRTYHIDHISKAFQAFLYLEDPDGNLLQENSSRDVGENARIVFRAFRTGTYRLIATSQGGFRTGTFSLSVRSGHALTKELPAWFKDLDKKGNGQITLQEWLDGGLELDLFREYDLNDDGVITAEEVLHLLKKPFELEFENGQVNYDGTIEENEETYRGKKAYQLFTIKLEQGRTYRIDHISEAFQAYLYLEDSDGNLFQEDSSRKVGENSHIVFRADKGGIYRLIATSRAGVRTGAFFLSVRSGHALMKGLPAWFLELDRDGDGQITLQEWLDGDLELDLFREYDRNNDGVITAEEVLHYFKKPFELTFDHGQVNYHGTLEEAGEETYRGKKSYKLFTIKLEQGRTYTIDHISEEFQAFLYLEDSDGNLLLEDSSRDVGEKSRIVFRADKGGTYRLIATSQGGFRTGDFSLSVRSGRPLPNGLPAWFKTLDKNGDGQITIQQWREGGRNLGEFRKYDLNGDGVITAAEVLRSLKK